MKTLLEPLLQFFRDYELIIPAAVGGLVDYMNQLYRKTSVWSIIGFCVHLSSAIFFGWLTGSLVEGLDYSHQAVASAGGIGGFLGTRVADLAVAVVNRVTGGKQ